MLSNNSLKPNLFGSIAWFGHNSMQHKHEMYYFLLKYRGCGCPFKFVYSSIGHEYIDFYGKIN